MQWRRCQNLLHIFLTMRRLSLLVMVLLATGGNQPTQAAPMPVVQQRFALQLPAADSSWSNFSTFDGPMGDVILCLHETADGYLWVGTTNGVSVRSPAGAWLTLSMDDGLAGNRVAAITTDPANPQRHWFATNGGASLLDDGGTPLDKRNHQWMTFGKRDGLLDHRLSSVTIAPNGDLWFGLTYIDTELQVRVGNGISVLTLNDTPFDKTDDSWSSFTAANSYLSTDVIHKLATDAAGVLWVATQSGLNAYQNGQWRLFSTEQGLPANEITTFLVVGRLLWVGTADGLGILDYGATLEDSSDDRWLTYTHLTGAETNSISALSIDPTGTLWVGTYELLEDDYSYLPRAVGNAMTIDLNQTPFDLNDDFILPVDIEEVLAPRALVAQAQGSWFVTQTGLRYATTHGAPFEPTAWEWRDDKGANGLASRSVSAIATFGGDRMALAFDGNMQLLRYGYTPHSLRDDHLITFQASAANTLATDSKERLWLGNGDSLTVLDPGLSLADSYDDEVHTYNASAGLRLDQINHIVIDNANRAWVANGSYLQGGLNVVAVGDSVEAISDDQMTTFTAQNSGLPGNYVTAVALGKTNEVWLGTNVGAAHLHYGTSPFVKQDDQWTAYTPQTSGIADQHIRDIAVDSTGNVWFALATGGVSLYTTGGEWVTFREADGLLLDEVNVVAVDQAGQIWFGTDGEGISVLDHKGTLTDKSDDSWTAYQPGAPLLSGYIQAITVDGWGQVWVGAFGGGLSVYSTVTFQQLHLPIIRQPYQ